MRQLLISTVMVIAAISTTSASDRYPTKKRYVNQTGEVVTIGNAPQMAAYAEVPVRRALPQLQIVPVVAAPLFIKPVPRMVTASSPARSGLFGAINVEPSDWPSGRKCCRPGEPYFNEEPNS